MKYPRKIQAAHVEELDNELCVYDSERKVVHNLNSTAAFVWEQCDGSTSPSQMATALESEMGTPKAEDVVWLSLDELKKAHLITGDVVRTVERSGMNRRTMLKGVAVASLPVIVSIVAPTAVQAQTPRPPSAIGNWRSGTAGAGEGEGFFDGETLSSEQLQAEASALCGGDGSYQVGTVENAAACAIASEEADASYFRWGNAEGGNCSWVFC